MKINSSVAANSYLLDAVTNNIDQGTSVRSSSLHSVRSIIIKLMLVVMIVGGWNVVKGAEQTITLDYSSFGLTTTYAEKTATVNGYGFTINQGYKGSGNVIQMNSSKGQGVLYNTTAIPGLKSITINVSSGSNTYTIYQGNSEKPLTSSAGTGTTTRTINITGGSQYFTLKVSGASYFSSIVITYETTPSVPYTVNFNNGTGTGISSRTEASAGAGIVLPPATPPAGCDPEYTFYGWATTSVSGTATAPSIVGVAGNRYYPSEDDITLYAVYKQGSESYQLVDLSTVSAGVYYLLTTDCHAFNGTISNGHGQVASEPFSFSGGYATSVPSGAIELTLTASGSGFTMYNSEYGYLYARQASSGNLAWQNTESSYWLYNSSNWKYNSNNALLRSYSNGSFRTYNTNNGDVLKMAKKVGFATYNTSPSCTHPTCLPPTALTSSSVGQNTATISWTAGDSETNWDYYYSSSSTNPTPSTTPSGYVSTTLTANISGLTANTTYYWWVRANCGGGDYSAWVSGGSFTTLNYTLSANSNDVDLGTVSVSGFVVTASLNDCAQYASPAYTVTSGSATVSQSGNIFNVTPSSNCTVRINFAEKPTYNVNWIVGGSTISTRSYCQGSTIPAGDVPADPTSSDCDGKTFVGWSAVEVIETNTRPSMFSRLDIAGTTVQHALTYYAVFAQVDGSELSCTLVTNVSQLSDGDEVVIAAKDYDVAISTEQRNNNRGEAQIEKGVNTIVTPLGEDVCVFRLESIDSKWAFYDASNNGYIYAASSTSNYLRTQTTNDANGIWTISISSNGIATIVAQGSYTHNILRYNSNDNGKLFSCYNSGNNMKDVAIYKKLGGIIYSAYSTSCTPCEADATVSSTALTASDITISSATIECPGGITNFGGAHCHISSYGFVYGTSVNPTLENGTEVVAGTTYTTTNTSFSKIIDGLDPCTTYHVRAYATNGHGTAYGPDFTFTTANNAAITSLTIDCMKNTGATISIEYTSCTTTSEIFAIAIRKGSNPPVSLGTTNPSDIAGNTEFGSGYMFGNPDLYSYVVYKGNSMPSSVTVTGLEAGHTYKLKAYRWIAEENKWTTNGTTMTLALPRITNLQRDNDETSETLTWNINGTVCDGGRYVVICKEGNSDVTSTCTDFTSITANTVFSTGTQTQTGEYVVHSGSETSVSITGLTAGTQYMAAVFYVDDEGNCSPKAQTTFTYSTTTILEPGDLAIVAIDNSINYGSNSGDEFSFMIFKNITPETSIDMTDNGYERNYEGYWGTSEGAFRITRKNSTLSAGSVITITEKDGRINNPTLGDYGNIDIYVNGSKDNANWEISWQGVGYDHFSEYGGDTIPAFDLNSADQIWIMQGGEWNYILKNKAEYTGNVLYGYTATGWKSSSGYNDNKGSTIYPGCDCFVSTLDLETGISKYKGPFTEATKREWITRINDESNWGDNYTTSNYTSTSPTYRTWPTSVLPIAPGDFTQGKWSGKKSSDWCDCANWMSLVVPDETVDVEIPSIGDGCNEVEIYIGDTAKCKTLTITALGRFRNTQENSTLQVVGDITIDANGTFRPSEGKSFEIKLGGNIVSNGVFITNENTSLTLFGEESHSISAPSNSDNLKLNNLTIGQALNNFASDTIELYGNLYDNSSSGNGFELPQSLSIRGTSSQTSTRTAITDITMNKSSNNLTLSGMLTVDGKAKFVKGNIIGNVTFLASATSSNANTDSYVDGTVTKKANASAFSFPTGSNGVLGTLEVSSLDADTDLKFNHEPDGFDASEMPVWWNQNNMCGPNEGNAKFDHVTNMYFWNLGTSATIADAVFSVSADDDVHFNSETIEHDNADIDMAIYDGCWKNLGGTAATSDPYHLISVSDVDLPATRAGGDKVLTFGSIDHNTLLPIELTVFSADCNGSYAKILWTTATERNNDYFVLERSDDAISFDEIARLAGAGSSINQIDYTYIDNNVHGGDIFYRLVQVDYDGTRSVSEIIAVNCAIDADGEPEMAVYPNPFANDLTLHFENFGDRVALVEVYDMLGRMLVSRKVACSQNDYEFVLPLGGLPDGAYNVRVSAEDVVINRQVVKNR